MIQLSEGKIEFKKTSFPEKKNQEFQRTSDQISKVEQ